MEAKENKIPSRPHNPPNLCDDCGGYTVRYMQGKDKCECLLPHGIAWKYLDNISSTSPLKEHETKQRLALAEDIMAIITQTKKYASQTIHAKTEPRSCPCLYGEPCNPRCTCIDVFSSSGCNNCCTYGSVEQREGRAKTLKGRITPHADTEEGLTKSDLEGLHKDYIESRKATTLQRVSEEEIKRAAKEHFSEEPEIDGDRGYKELIWSKGAKWMQDRLTQPTEREFYCLKEGLHGDRRCEKECVDCNQNSL